MTWYRLFALAVLRRVVMTLAVFLLAILGCYGCRVDGPEFRVESVFVVTLREEPGLLPWSRDRDVDNQEVVLLKVALSSETDLVRFARRSETHIGYTTYLCDPRNGLNAQVYSPAYLMAGGVSLGDMAYSQRENLDDLRGPNGRVLYQVVVPLDGKEMRRIYPESKEVPLYNYKENMADLCIRVHGGAMWGEPFSANWVVVPRDAVISAIKAAGHET